MEVNDGIELHRIRITSATIAEVVARQSLVSIPRADVRKLRIQRGLVTERPWVLASFGLIVTALGAVGIMYLLRLLLSPGNVGLSSRVMAAILVSLGAGPSALYFAFRRGLMVLVDTTRSTRKLSFGAPVTGADLAAFVDAARALGLDVEVGADMPRASVVGGTR